MCQSLASSPASLMKPMTSVLFIDANVPIYAAGIEHPLKAPCAGVMRLAADNPGSFVTDAEVLQELLHRYLAIGKREQGIEVVRDFAMLMRDRVEPIYAIDVESAAALAQNSSPRLSARDLLHLSVVYRLGLRHVVTADADYLGLPDIQLLTPQAIADWAPGLGLT